MSNPLGWDLPAGAANDHNAPWNQPDGHCSCCPAHEDSEEWDDPQCTECDDYVSRGVCYLYTWLPERVAQYLVRFKRLWGLFPSCCSPQDEPECKCGDCTCADRDDDDDDCDFADDHDYYDED